MFLNLEEYILLSLQCNNWCRCL